MSNLKHSRVHLNVWLLTGLVALLFSACNFPVPTSQPLAPPVSIPVSSPPPQPTPAQLPTFAPTHPLSPTRASVLPDDPLVAVIYAMRAQLKAMPFSSQTTVDTGGTQLKSLLEVESLQRVLLVTTSGSFKLVDGQCYEKRENDVWRACLNPKATTSAMAGAISLLDPAAIDVVVAMIKTVKWTGTETLDGIRCRIYEYTLSGDQFGVHSEGTSRLWVAEDDGLPIKQVTTSTTGGYSATTTLLIDYSPTLTVRAP